MATFIAWIIKMENSFGNLKLLDKPIFLKVRSMAVRGFFLIRFTWVQEIIIFMHWIQQKVFVTGTKNSKRDGPSLHHLLKIPHYFLALLMIICSWQLIPNPEMFCGRQTCNTIFSVLRHFQIHWFILVH